METIFLGPIANVVDSLLKITVSGWWNQLRDGVASGNFHMSFEPPGALRALFIARNHHLSRFHFRVTGYGVWRQVSSGRLSGKPCEVLKAVLTVHTGGTVSGA